MVFEDMKLKECVANGIVGEYGHVSILYHIVCSQPKAKKRMIKNRKKEGL